MSKFNGHRSWNAWNVSLWINNDEGLYRRAYDLARLHGVKLATRQLSCDLEGQKTPDGAVYNPTCIREALRGIL